MINFKKFKNKKVLITGHTGFKGAWLTLILSFLGAKIYGVSLKPKKKSMYYQVALNKILKLDKKFDIRSFDKLKTFIDEIKPDYIFHLAAQALVKNSFVNPLDTLSTNIIGTTNILEIARSMKKKCIIILITSDKCYKNKEQIWGYKESDEMGGNEPYSASKASCEIIINAYFQSYFKKINSNVKIASVRAGNVIGGGDWSENRIIPDCVRSWEKKIPLILNNPQSTRPWQHVLEPLFGYLKLALSLEKKNNLNGESFNFGPNSNSSLSVVDLVKLFSNNWVYSKIKVNRNSNFKEQNLLKLDCTKVYNQIKWEVILTDKEMLEMTSLWYLNYNRSRNILSFTNSQIKNYYEKIISKQ